MDGETGGLTLFDRNDVTTRCYAQREETIVSRYVKTHSARESPRCSPYKSHERPY